MNLLKNTKELLSRIETNPLIKDKDYELQSELIRLLYEFTNGDLLFHFMMIDKLSKAEHEKEINLMYQGLQDSMHSASFLASLLLEEKTSRKAKDAANFYFNQDNLSFLINIAKAYFKNGTSEGCSNSGQWFFDKFLTILKTNKDKYLEGGKSHDWAVNYNHIDYIKLVLERNR